MPRIRFYNRRSRHEHPKETPISETARQAPWENPPTFDFETAPRLFGFRLDVRAAPDHLAVIRPPTATRLTACLPASGLSTTSFSHGLFRRAAHAFRARGEAPGHCLPKVPLPTRPSDTSIQRPDRDPLSEENASVPCAWPCFHRSTSMPRASTEPKCLPSWETDAGTLSSLGVVGCPGWPARAGTARVHPGLEDRD